MIEHHQVIYFGAPGTGKSYHVNKQLENINNKKIFRVTIHPEFTYSDFIGQILPVQKNNGNINFEFKPGVFTEALKEAFSDYKENVFLILEEVSRGNVSAILGDIFQLLDRDDFFQSRYPVRNINVANEIVELIGDEIFLPSNFNIIGTVNVNDQSVFPMDTAFKRRFDWKYVSSLPIKDGKGQVLNDLNNPKLKIKHKQSEIETNWLSFYTALNKYITDKTNGLGRSEDKQIGQFFIKFDKSSALSTYSTDREISNESNNKINEKIQSKLLLYLWQDIEDNNFYNENKLFSENINNFDDLYFEFENNQVFSDNFLNNFLIPNKDKFLGVTL